MGLSAASRCRSSSRRRDRSTPAETPARGLGDPRTATRNPRGNWGSVSATSRPPPETPADYVPRTADDRQGAAWGCHLPSAIEGLTSLKPLAATARLSTSTRSVPAGADLITLDLSPASIAQPGSVRRGSEGDGPACARARRGGRAGTTASARARPLPDAAREPPVACTVVLLLYDAVPARRSV